MGQWGARAAQIWGRPRRSSGAGLRGPRSAVRMQIAAPGLRELSGHWRRRLAGDGGAPCLRLGGGFPSRARRRDRALRVPEGTPPAPPLTHPPLAARPAPSSPRSCPQLGLASGSAARRLRHVRNAAGGSDAAGRFFPGLGRTAAASPSPLLPLTPFVPLGGPSCCCHVGKQPGRPGGWGLLLARPSRSWESV